MQCRFCSAPASVTPARDAVQVGLCQTHLRAGFRALQHHRGLHELKRRIDRKEAEF